MAFFTSQVKWDILIAAVDAKSSNADKQQILGEKKQRQDEEGVKAADIGLMLPASLLPVSDQRDVTWASQEEWTVFSAPECYMFDLRNQNNSPRESAAMKAVVTLLAHSTAAWLSSTEPLEMAPRITAATAARSPTTVAWTWGPKDKW